MKRLLGCLLAAALAISGGSRDAFAQPVTFQGTLGKLEIVVELTAHPARSGARPSGRYFYRSKGIDIPLHFVSFDDNVLRLVEEEPCDREACPEGTAAPLGAIWVFGRSRENAGLEGRWNGGRSLPVSLRLVGDRGTHGHEAATPKDLFEDTLRLAREEQAVTPQARPYDFLRLDVEDVLGETTRWDDAAFAMVADPRTRFVYPRVSALPEGASPDAVNALLRARHWWKNLAALGCAAQRYIGFHAFPGDWGAEVGSLGGFEDITVSVTQLTGRVIGWTESGSLWCGGASPHNFHIPYLADVKRGSMLGMPDIFRGWTEDGPSAELLSFVRARRELPASEIDRHHEEECGIDGLMETHLSARLMRSESGRPLVVFGIYGLPTVIAACGDDLLTLPLADVIAFLTEEAAELLR